MRDKLLDFIEGHRVLSFIILGVVLLFVVMLIVRTINMSNKDNNTVSVGEEQTTQYESVSDETTKKQSSYQSGLSIKAQEESKKQAEIEQKLKEKQEEESRIKAEEARRQEELSKEPTYGDKILVWGHDTVRDVLDDGSSPKKYFDSIKLSDFGSKWGSDLSIEDKFTEDIVMVGVNQNENDVLKGVQNQSFGWLIDNLDNLSKNCAVKFTDLNIIGSLSNDHVALLCCYNWYSVWGLKETLLVFEDISNTLNISDFNSGDIFSAFIYVHNIKVEKVNGQTVICVQYNTFK